MKALYTSLLVLLCWTGVQAQEPQEHEYFPMLREDLVWVGNYYDGNWNDIYCIKVKGDTVVNGVTYKKCYRLRQDGYYWRYDPDFPYQNINDSFRYFDPYVPASCMREENGKVYRLCEKGREFIYCFRPESEFHNYTSEWLNETDTHYELLVYDFDNPNIYIFNSHETDLASYGSVEAEGKQRRLYMNNSLGGHRVFIEGYGALGGGVHGSDMLEPCRTNWPTKDYFQFEPIYVRNDKGEVLYYEDFEDDDDWDEFYTDANGNYYPLHYRDAYDFNDDGSFDVGDLNKTINIMLGLAEDNIIARSPDLTFDQKVDIEDLNLIINRMLSDVEPIKYSDLRSRMQQ